MFSQKRFWGDTLFPKTQFWGYSFPKNVIFGDSLFPKRQFWGISFSKKRNFGDTLFPKTIFGGFLFPKTIFGGCSFPKNVIFGETANSQNCFLGSRLPKASSPKYSFGEMSYTSCWKISPSQKHSFGKILPSQKRIFGNRNLLFLCIINKMKGDFIAILLSNHQYHS